MVMNYLICRYLKLNPDPLPEQLTADPSLQSHQHLFIKLSFIFLSVQSLSLGPLHKLGTHSTTAVVLFMAPSPCLQGTEA